MYGLFIARDVTKREFQHEMLLPPVGSLQPPSVDAGRV